MIDIVTTFQRGGRNFLSGANVLTIMLQWCDRNKSHTGPRLVLAYVRA